MRVAPPSSVCQTDRPFQEPPCPALSRPLFQVLLFSLSSIYHRYVLVGQSMCLLLIMYNFEQRRGVLEHYLFAWYTMLSPFTYQTLWLSQNRSFKPWLQCLDEFEEEVMLW